MTSHAVIYSHFCAPMWIRRNCHYGNRTHSGARWLTAGSYSVGSNCDSG